MESILPELYLAGGTMALGAFFWLMHKAGRYLTSKTETTLDDRALNRVLVFAEAAASNANEQIEKEVRLARKPESPGGKEVTAEEWAGIKETAYAAIKENAWAEFKGLVSAETLLDAGKALGIPFLDRAESMLKTESTVKSLLNGKIKVPKNLIPDSAPDSPVPPSV